MRRQRGQEVKSRLGSGRRRVERGGVVTASNDAKCLLLATYHCSDPRLDLPWARREGARRRRRRGVAIGPALRANKVAVDEACDITVDAGRRP
eukprot:scaffold64466_cov24-Tisochrysis_lutea.AAC.4